VVISGSIASETECPRNLARIGFLNNDSYTMLRKWTLSLTQPYKIDL